MSKVLLVLNQKIRSALSAERIFIAPLEEEAPFQGLIVQHYAVDVLEKGRR